MSLRYALLGLLEARPSSGYDLSQRFAAGIGAYAWDAKHSQIYPELKKLLGEGLISIAEEGARGRKTYAITAEGHVELRDWLLTPPATQGGVRNEYVLRLFLLPTLDRREAAEVLRHTADTSQEQLDVLSREYAEAAASAGAPGALAAQYGLHLYQATKDWAEWALDHLEDLIPDTEPEQVWSAD